VSRSIFSASSASPAGSGDAEISDMLSAVSCGTSDERHGQVCRRFFSCPAHPTTLESLTGFTPSASHAGSGDAEISAMLHPYFR
jgi:hypothetical protein